MQHGNTRTGEAEKREVGGGGAFTKGHRRSSNSLESLYSLNSGQSSSSKHLQAKSQVYSSHHYLMNYATLACTLKYPVYSPLAGLVYRITLTSDKSKPTP